MIGNIAVTVELASHQAEALAQFVKRLGWDQIRACAVDDAEGRDIRDAIEAVRRSLADAGFAPR